MTEKKKIRETSNIGQTGQNHYCKCGHLKDIHVPTVEGNIVCSKKNCPCEIIFK